MVRMTVAVRVITVVIVFVVMMGMHNVDLYLMWIRVDKDKQPSRRTSFAFHHSPRPRKARLVCPIGSLVSPEKWLVWPVDSPASPKKCLVWLVGGPASPKKCRL